MKVECFPGLDIFQIQQMVNKWLGEHDFHVIDIKYSTHSYWIPETKDLRVLYSAMIIYSEKITVSKSIPVVQSFPFRKDLLKDGDKVKSAFDKGMASISDEARADFIKNFDYADPNGREITEEEGVIIVLYNDLQDLFKDKSIVDKDEIMKKYYDQITPLFNKLFEPQQPDDPYYITLDSAKKNLIFFYARVGSIFEHKELQ